MNAALKPFLARSFGLHSAAAVAFLFLASRRGAPNNPVYMIDFVGGSAATIQNAGVAASAPSASAAGAQAVIAPQADADAVNVHGRRRGPVALPRPSLLRAGARASDSAPTLGSLAGPGVAAAPTAPSSIAGDSSAGAGVATDLPNFPYPWYISQVRLMLWQAWQKRMPAIESEGAVAFSILRNGSITDLFIEGSSGDRDFDSAALEAVQSAAPFPALPTDFREPFLKIHLSLKSQNSWR